MLYMEIYLVLTLLTIIIRNRKAEFIFFNIAFLLLFTFVTFRWQVGCDFYSYKNQYEIKYANIHIEDALSDREPGYTLAIFLLQSISADWSWMNVLSAVAFFSGLYALARRQPNPLYFLTLCYPVLILTLSTSAIRQAAAAGFIYLAGSAYIEKRVFLYLSLVLIASTFHRSAFVFIVFAPLLVSADIRVKIIAGLSGVVLTSLLADPSEMLQGYSAAYIGSGLDAQGGAYRVLPVFIAGCIYIFSRKRWSEKYPREAAFLNVMFIPMVLTLPVVFISTVIGDRFNYYLMPAAFMVFGRMQLLAARGSTFLFAAPLVGSFFELGVWLLYSIIVQACFTPYQSWLDVM